MTEEPTEGEKALHRELMEIAHILGWEPSGMPEGCTTSNPIPLARYRMQEIKALRAENARLATKCEIAFGGYDTKSRRVVELETHLANVRRKVDDVMAKAGIEPIPDEEWREVCRGS